MVKRRKAEYIPARGDIIWLSFSPQSGHEQAGRRPALVLTPRAYSERRPFALCCPITSRAKGYPFEVGLTTTKIKGVVLADQAYTFDWKSRRAEFIGKAPASVVEDVGNLVATLARG